MRPELRTRLATCPRRRSASEPLTVRITRVSPVMATVTAPVSVWTSSDSAFTQITNFLGVGLTYEGFSVAVAEDGPAALAELGRFKPQLVILDLMLPGMSGMELAERLRADRDLMIIMLTARDQVEDRIAGLKAGADDYLVKPFDFEELVARIHAVARRRFLPEGGVLKAGPITLDNERRLVKIDGAAVEGDRSCLQNSALGQEPAARALTPIHPRPRVGP